MLTLQEIVYEIAIVESAIVAENELALIVSTKIKLISW